MVTHHCWRRFFWLIWGYFQNVWKGRFWGHWGQRMFEVEFWGCDLEISESLAANLEKVRLISICQMVPKFDFDIFLFALLKRVSLWGTIKKTKIRNLELFVIQRSALLFWGSQLNFQECLTFLKLNLEHLLTSMAPKRPFQTFWNKPQINTFVPKIDGRHEF